ncbi:unnamed protein product, partial [Phaeothamnion confervicola]
MDFLLEVEQEILLAEERLRRHASEAREESAFALQNEDEHAWGLRCQTRGAGQRDSTIAAAPLRGENGIPGRAAAESTLWASGGPAEHNDGLEPKVTDENRYRGAPEREQLIARLLIERELRIAHTGTSDAVGGAGREGCGGARNDGGSSQGGDDGGVYFASDLLAVPADADVGLEGPASSEDGVSGFRHGGGRREVDGGEQTSGAGGHFYYDMYGIDLPRPLPPPMKQHRPQQASLQPPTAPSPPKWWSGTPPPTRTTTSAAAPTSPTRITEDDGSGSPVRRHCQRQAAAAAVHLEQQCTFSPRINDDNHSSSAGRWRQQRQRPPPAPPTPERLAQLARDREAAYSERERLRLEAEAEAQRACTFRPNLCHRREKVGARDAGGGGSSGVGIGGGGDGRLEAVHERLHRAAREREAATAAARHLIQEAELTECTFWPRLVTTGAMPAVAEAAAPQQRRCIGSGGGSSGGGGGQSRAPLHERVWEVQRAKEERRRLLEAEQAEREGSTFQPRINSISVRLAAHAQHAHGAARNNAATASVAAGGAEAETVAERLMREAARAAERLQRRREEVDEEERRRSNYEPQLSSGTRRLVRQRPQLRAPFE